MSENLFLAHKNILSSEGGREFIRTLANEMLSKPAPRLRTDDLEGFRNSAKYAQGYYEGWHAMANALISEMRKALKDDKEMATLADELDKKSKEYNERGSDQAPHKV